MLPLATVFCYSEAILAKIPVELKGKPFLFTVVVPLGLPVIPSAGLDFSHSEQNTGWHHSNLSQEVSFLHNFITN